MISSHHRHQDIIAIAMSKALQDAGFGVAVVVTDIDRLQASILEAQFFLDRENEREARKVLMEVLKQ